ncbi:MAG: Fur family zinc uptake transcriptional regulator [Rickettsiales bacterium]|jgi:Fur family zinc uptake transcriptional regulator
MTSCNDHNKCVNDAFEDAEEICIKNNLRFTDLRKKVFSIILQNHKPSKAYDVLDILQKEDSSAKPTTVYRTLDFLLECGLIHKLHISNSYVTCSHPLKHARCSFLICNKCSEVQECCDKDLTNQLKKIGSKNDFIIEDATVEIRGICASCV